MSGFGAPLFGPNGDDRAQHNINSKASIEGLNYYQYLRKQFLIFHQQTLLVTL